MKLKNIFQNYTPHILLGLYAIWFAILAINPYDRSVWWVENLTVLIIVAIIVLLYIFKIRFSPIAYILMSVLIFMHTYGGHYTFERAPFDWFNNMFGFERNMYDRVAHATVGLYAYALVEASLKYKWANKKWYAYLSAIAMIAGIAAVYEIFEWWYAVSADPEAGIAVLGSQGDIWDAQKDMLMDTSGAVLGVIIYQIKEMFSKNK